MAEIDLLDIPYADLKTWEEYIKNEIVDLYKKSSTVRDLFKQAAELQGKDFEKLDESTKRILLGGVSLDPTTKQIVFTKNSSAKFYRNVFGLSIDYDEYIAKKLANLKVETFVKFDKDITNLPFYSYVKSINMRAEKIIDTLKPRFNLPDISYDKVNLNDPEGVINLLKEFFQSAINFSAVYNPKTFFIISLRGNIYKAFLEAYSKLKDKEVRKNLFSLFGVDLMIDYFNNQNQDYKIYGFKENSIGYEITNLDVKVYNMLKYMEDYKFGDIIQIIPNIVNDYKFFLNNCNIDINNYSNSYFTEYKILNNYIVSLYKRGTHFGNKNLVDALEELSYRLLIDLKIEKIDLNGIEIGPLRSI
jgi:hypothetical protein